MTAATINRVVTGAANQNIIGTIKADVRTIDCRAVSLNIPKYFRIIICRLIVSIHAGPIIRTIKQGSPAIAKDEVIACTAVDLVYTGTTEYDVAVGTAINGILASNVCVHIRFGNILVTLVTFFLFLFLDTGHTHIAEDDVEACGTDDGIVTRTTPNNNGMVSIDCQPGKVYEIVSVTAIDFDIAIEISK